MTAGSTERAPARTSARAGALAFTLLAVVLGASACDRAAPGRDDGPRVIELAHDTIRLEAGVRLHDVQVRRETGGEFHPSQVEARVGDYVRFTADDGAGHAVVFVGASLDPAARAFLDQSGQLRSPPLIARGSSWVITLEGAPAGEYPFHCTTHNVNGHLRVAAQGAS